MLRRLTASYRPKLFGLSADIGPETDPRRCRLWRQSAPPPHRRFFWAAALLLLPAAARAQGPTVVPAALRSVSPAGFRRGQILTLTFGGVNLSPARDVIFDDA